VHRDLDLLLDLEPTFYQLKSYLFNFDFEELLIVVEYSVLTDFSGYLDGVS
jgi:hypothetical protein